MIESLSMINGITLYDFGIYFVQGYLVLRKTCTTQSVKLLPISRVG